MVDLGTGLDVASDSIRESEGPNKLKIGRPGIEAILPNLAVLAQNPQRLADGIPGGAAEIVPRAVDWNRRLSASRPRRGNSGGRRERTRQQQKKR